MDTYSSSIIFLPLVLPPTVLGYYFLVAFSGQAPLGGLWEFLFGRTLNFSFEGLLIASVIANLPLLFNPFNMPSALSIVIYVMLHEHAV
ncbi:MAG: hypothetical protein LRY63_08660 [Nitrincola sp.]|nr:hypothetical protein [Nitrincola sp.]